MFNTLPCRHFCELFLGKSDHALKLSDVEDVIRRQEQRNEDSDLKAESEKTTSFTVAFVRNIFSIMRNEASRDQEIVEGIDGFRVNLLNFIDML